MAEAPSSVLQLVEQKLGHPVVEREISGTVGTTAAGLVLQNPRRLGLVLYNLSAGVLFVRPRREASSTNGLRVAAGGFRSWWWEEDFTFQAQRLSIIGDGANLAYYGIEYLIRG